MQQAADAAALRRHAVVRPAATLVAGWALALAATPALAQVDPPPVIPPALSTLKVPTPANLGDFVVSKSAAVALGKALFWDIQVGSDGKTSCASCHFAAGADPRSKNQLSQGARGAGLAALQAKGVNYQLKPSDFPFHRLSDPSQANSPTLQSLSMVGSSQGVFKDNFVATVPGSGAEARTVAFDPVFTVGGINVRQVEPRNTPTVINAVFNLRNFWDGRAQTIFNGVNPFGRRDEGARVHRLVGGLLIPTAITLNDSSLASQASGPPGSVLEMSADGRSFPELGRKMLALRPLAQQQVARDDSVLGSKVGTATKGLGAHANYAEMVKLAFKPEWHAATQKVNVGGKAYSQMEANFSLIWGIALQAYQATLVSDQAPFDRWRQGSSSALTPNQIAGLGVFMGKGKCINCHGGAAFTNAAIERKLIGTERLSQMLMGNGATAVYDEGFYNIGITRTADDPGVGGTDPWGRPLSFSGLARNGTVQFTLLEGEVPNVLVLPGSRIAVQGAFKTPTLRNVELTAPYFHDGSLATLRQVVEFYNRGGNFAANNRADLDADIQPLGLSNSEIDAVVDFLRALTDDRVTRHAAPFDHPELLFPSGQVGNTVAVLNDGQGRAVDQELLVPPVGAGGYKSSAAVPLFLGMGQKAGLLAQYFKSTDPAGMVAAQRVEQPGLSLPAGAAPVSGLGTSSWSVRWTGYLRAPATGTLALYVNSRSDDGVRLWVNNQLAIDNWAVPSRTTSTTAITVKAGDLVPVRMEAWDQGGAVQVGLSWIANGTGAPVLIPADSLVPDEGLGLRAQYFNSKDLSGAAVASVVQLPGIDVGTGTVPASGLGTSNWSVSWTGRLVAPAAGTYTLQVENLADDGVRLWLDGRLAIDNWALPSGTLRSTTVSLQAGQSLPLRLDAWDAAGAAKVTLKWAPPGSSTLVPLTLDHLRP